MFDVNESRKRARFWQRFYAGAESADILRFLTLNSSDESVICEIDILESFRKLVKRIRRKYRVFEYFGVVVSGTEPLREHIHVVCKGVYMRQDELESMWIDVHKSIKPWITVVHSVGSAVGYLGQYLNQQSSHVRKYIMSAGWVFPGWVSWSKWYKRNYGKYPDEVCPGTLAKLSRMSKSERDEIILPELMRIG